MKNRAIAVNRIFMMMLAFNSALCINMSAESVAYAHIYEADRDMLRESAVVAGREGRYEQALDVLEKLYRSSKDDLKSAYDYMTILHWSGKNKEAVAIFENNQYKGMPDYVVLNIAAAYYRLAKYEKSLELINSLADKEDENALLLKWQIFIRQNSINMADSILEKIFNDNDLEKALQFKTNMAAEIHNWQWSAQVYKEALQEHDKGNFSSANRKDLVDKLSVAYLRIGRAKDAAFVLQPYIQDKSATVNMIGNYIVALRSLNQFSKAIDVYDDFFDGIAAAPVFVLREVAECFYQDKKYVKAAEIYQYICTSGYAIQEDRFRMAYIGCMTSRYRTEGIASYKELLHNPKKSSFITRVLVDAHNLLMEGKLKAADSVYGLLIAGDKRFISLYVDDLIQEEQYQTAWYLSEKMFNDKELSVLGMEKLSTISTRLRNYKTAKYYESMLSKQFVEESSYSEAAGNAKNRLNGELYLYSDMYNDNDDSDSYSLGLYATQNLDGSFWAEVETGTTSVREYGKKIRVNMEGLGLRYSGRKLDTLVGMSRFSSLGDKKAGLRVDSLFRPDDKQNLHFKYAYEPIMDIDALDYERGSVFADRYALRYTYYFNQFESVYAEARFDDYDFDNNKKGWLIGHDLQIYNDIRNDRSLKRSIYWSRDFYKDQYVPYTSPELQENIGIEWRWERSLDSNNVLFHILGVNWERDYPDPLTLSPFYRIEYQHSFSKHQFLAIGTGLGWESESWLGKGCWKYQDNYFDISYNLTW